VNDTRKWQTIREELSTHPRVRVMITDDTERVHHIRVFGKPEANQREIYKKLRITDPLRREHRIVSRRL